MSNISDIAPDQYGIDPGRELSLWNDAGGGYRFSNEVEHGSPTVVLRSLDAVVLRPVQSADLPRQGKADAAPNLIRLAEGHLGWLPFSFARSTDHREFYQTNGIPESFHLRFPFTLPHLRRLAEPLLSFHRRMEESFAGMPCHWNPLTFQPEGVHLLNIHNGNAEEWRRLYSTLVERDTLKNWFVVFYGLESTEPRLEIQKTMIRILKARQKTVLIKLQLASEYDDCVETIRNGYETEWNPRHFHSRISDGTLRAIEELFGKAVRDSCSFLAPSDYAELAWGLEEKQSFAAIERLGELSTKLVDAVFKAGHHAVQAEKESSLRGIGLAASNDESFKKVGRWGFWEALLRTMEATLSLLRSNKDLDPDTVGRLTVHIIDDNPESLRSKVDVLKSWFEKLEISFSDNWKLDAEALCENTDKKRINNLLEYDILIIDLVYEGRELGFEILKALKERTRGSGKPLVVMLSRRDDPRTVQRALNSGALFFVSKSHFFELVPRIAEVWSFWPKTVEEKEDSKKRHIQYRRFENWHSLHRLPLSKVLELQETVISGEEYRPPDNGSMQLSREMRRSADVNWIQKFPKAEVHCHIGSCMAAPLLPQLAFVILEELVEKKRDVGALLPEVVTFAMPVAFDPYLDESGKRWIFETSDYADYARMFGDAKQEHSLFQQAEDLLRDLRNVTPEEAILSCEDTSLEELVDHARWGAYVTRKRELRQKFRTLGLNAYDVTILVFVLLLHIRETGDKGLSDLATRIKNDSTDDRLKGIAKNRTLNAQFWDSCAKVISGELPKPEGDSYPILSMLRNAHSTKRCMGESRASLFSYLRCCQYSGAPFLQSQTAIYLTAKSVVRDYAVPDNIRYLCLRCNIIGYTSFGLQKREDVIRYLLDAFKFYGQDRNGSEFRSNGTTVLVNLIVSANRAKTETAVEQNVNLVMEYLRTSEPAPCSPRVVSFDLMGLEKGNRPEKFLKVMTPLLKECFPITVHAGEEDEAESIWQAVYLIQSQRIGHGLSLRNNEKLMALVRERHVSVELCPLSNLLTNGKFKAPGSSDKPDHSSPEYYPLRQYLDENLDVTINTDNPMISSATLSQEYIVAAKYSGGLTKWEVLRLIKNAFRSAAIPKQEKRELMNKIDDEIFEILLNEA